MHGMPLSPTDRKPTLRQLREQRCAAANEFLQAIAGCGRRFFRNTGSGHDGYLSLNARGSIVWFHDDYTGAQINTARDGRWAGFSHGGTLKMLLSSIGHYVLTGTGRLRYGYFQPAQDGRLHNPWGYGDDILLVREAGVRLGLIAAPAPSLHPSEPGREEA